MHHAAFVMDFVTECMPAYFGTVKSHMACVFHDEPSVRRIGIPHGIRLRSRHRARPANAASRARRVSGLHPRASLTSWRFLNLSTLLRRH